MLLKKGTYWKYWIDLLGTFDDYCWTK